MRGVPSRLSAASSPTAPREVFTKTSHSVTITALPQYLVEQSEPARNHFVWAYTIHIQNDGAATVQLLNRHWHITDAFGRSQHVRGPGVVGKQPVLRPGESFRYTSGVPLTTPSGFMEGEYEMQFIDSGATFEAQIPLFSLDSPFENSKPN